MGNNTELCELTGRAAALRDLINLRKKRESYSRRVDIDEIEAIMGWADGCRKNGHPANEQDEEKTAGEAAVNP